MFVLQGLENKLGKCEFKGLFCIMKEINFFVKSTNKISGNVL
jgi:hypothetical protein